MDAAIDIQAKSASLNLGIKHTVPVRTHVVGVGVFDLAWNERVRVAVPAGDHVVVVWAKMLRNPTQGLSHAALHLEPGQSVGLQWRMPGSLFGSGAMQVGTGARPVRYAQPLPDVPPAANGKSRLSPPHEVEALVPLTDAPLPLVAVPAAPEAPPPAAAWHPDPTGRYPHRWWDGTRWTDAVSDGATTLSDPVPGL